MSTTMTADQSPSSDAPLAAERAGGGSNQGAILRSEELLQGRSTIVIEHNGAAYRLQTTRQGKLILTK